MTKLYYESHITIDPVFDDAREMASELAKQYKFKLATLIMRKREADEEKPAEDDTFMTGHSKDYQDISARTRGLVELLQTNGYQVRRYKIEDTLVDSRSNDEWGLLHTNDA